MSPNHSARRGRLAARPRTPRQRPNRHTVSPGTLLPAGEVAALHFMPDVAYAIEGIPQPKRQGVPSSAIIVPARQSCT